MSDLTLFDTAELTALLKLDLENQRLEEALSKCKIALNRDDCPPEVYALSGKLYGQLRLFAHAEKQYQQYVSLYPENLTAQFELGMTLFDQGRAEEAQAIWRNVLSHDEKHPPALFFLALSCMQQGDLARAREHFERILQSTPVNNLYYGKAREELSKLDERTRTLQEQRDNGAANH